MFSLISTTCIFFGFLLKISLVTDCPIEPAPPIIKNEEFEHALGKDLHYLQSFIVKITGIKSSGTCEWSVFGFVGDKVLVECNRYGDYRHFELFSPEEIGLIIDLDYRLKKENYFDRLIYRPNAHGSPILEGIKKIKFLTN